MAKPTSAATEARRLRELEERRKREAYRLKLHNERVQQSDEATRTRRVMGVRRSKPATPMPPSARHVAWWCRPEVREFMDRMLTTTAQHPRPSGCPECGGVRIKWQTNLDGGIMLFVCPVDWSPNIRNTGCGRRFGYNPVTGSRTTQEARTGRPDGNVPQNTGEEFDPSDFEEPFPE